MRRFESLQADVPLESFDAEVHGEEPIIQLEESAGRITISYSFPGFYISDDERQVDGRLAPFRQINIASAGFLAESGKPLLPSFGRYVQIPLNCDYEIKFDKGQAVEFENVLVLPAQERLLDSPGAQHNLEYDRELYAMDAVYPERMVRVSGPAIIDDYAALLVHVVPFEYYPAERRLLGYGRVTITIEIIPRELPGHASSAAPDSDREAYGNFFVNPGRGIEERLDMAPTAEQGLYYPPRRPEFLILYHASLEQAAHTLLRWKRMRGLRCEAVAIDQVGTDTAALKTYLRHRRQADSRLRYVLLLGDVELIPTEIVTGGPWGDNATDYYYATPRDPERAEDLVMPWLAIGRLPVSAPVEALNVVHKIVDYERHPPRRADYYRRMVFAAYFQDDDRDGRADRGYLQAIETIGQQMVSMGFEVERIYVGTEGAPRPMFFIDNTPVPQEAVDAMMSSAEATARLIGAVDEGRLIAAHRDHGTQSGWQIPPFTQNHLVCITGKAPTMFYSINCLTGQFDLQAPARSFAETLLHMEGGAPSLIAATRVSHTWLNNDLIKALFDAMWGGVLPAFPGGTASYPVRHNRLGDILNYGKAYLPVALSGSNAYVRDHFEIYHVIGDPTLEVWRHAPRRVSLRTWVDRRYLYIILRHIPSDAVITVWSRGELLKRMEPASPYVRLALPWEALRDRLSLCFWAPGYRFREIRPKLREEAE
jgi:hypothetical protein